MEDVQLSGPLHPGLAGAGGCQDPEGGHAFPPEIHSAILGPNHVR